MSNTMAGESTSTSVELQQLPLSTTGRSDNTIDARSPPPLHDNSSTTDILAASAYADSQAPEGGYGWVVVLGCAVLTWWFVGTSYSWGVLQAALVKSGFSSPSTLSFVGSLTAACISFLGVLNGRVIRKLGSRWTAMLGILFLGGGEVLSGFSTGNIGGLFFTTGVITGVGTR
jgi:hypothetical protein